MRKNNRELMHLCLKGDHHRWIQTDSIGGRYTGCTGSRPQINLSTGRYITIKCTCECHKTQP